MLWKACFLYALVGVAYGVYVRHRIRGLQEELADRAKAVKQAAILHESFLQECQGLILQIHAAVENLPRNEEGKRKLEQTLVVADELLVSSRDQSDEIFRSLAQTQRER